MKRIAGFALTAAMATGCGGGARLGAPSDATLPATTAPTTTDVQCTDEQASLDPERSYSPAPTQPTPSVDEIRTRGRLIVGVSADTLLFGARNPLVDGAPIEGFDIDILKEVAAAIFGVDVGAVDDFIEYRVITYAQRLPSLEAGPDNGGVDIVAHTMTINCRRWLRIAFSTNYFDAGQKVLVRDSDGYDGIDDLVASKATVCAVVGSTNLAFIEGPDYAGKGLVAVGDSDLTDCLVGMQQGRYDAVTGDDTVLAGFAAQDPGTRVVGEAFTEEPYGLGIAADRVDLVRFVNAVLDDVRTSGRWAEIYDRWLIQTGGFELPIPQPPQPVYGRDDS